MLASSSGRLLRLTALLAIGSAAIALVACGQGAVLSKSPEEDRPAPPPARVSEERRPPQPPVEHAVSRPPKPAPRSAATAPSSPPPAGASGAKPLPPASAGTNGSFDPPSSAEVESITPRTHEALGREGAGPTAILLGGVALAPPGAPEPIKGAISAANSIIGRPYVWGGGHVSFYSTGYDCSGAVSFALFGAGLIPKPLTSTELEGWGEPGPGRWITVYANGSHAYAVIAGLRWDTVGDARGTGPRWHPNDAYPEGFVARHAPGY